MRECSNLAYLAALFTGIILSGLLAATLVLAGLRAGITPGVSPLIVLAGWLLLAPLRRVRKSEFLLITQIAGSGGAAVTAGVIFTAPILQIAQIDGFIPQIDIHAILYASIAGVFLGWGAVGLSMRGMLDDERLPAPEARACEQILIRADAGQSTTASFAQLLRSLVLPAFVTIVTASLSMLRIVREYLLSFSWQGATIAIPISPLYWGIGALLTFETATLLLFGGLAHSAVRAYTTAVGLPGDTYRWVGAAAMTVSICYTLTRYVLGRWKEVRSLSFGLDTPIYWIFCLSIYVGLLMAMRPLFVYLMHPATQTTITPVQTLISLGVAVLVLAVLLSAIGALLSLQVGSSASPVSGTVFVGMLCLALLTTFVFEKVQLSSLVYVLVSLCVAICAANDSSQDYKTLKLRGYPVEVGLIPQFLGLLVGALVVPATMWIVHEAFVLGSNELPAPQASFFSVVLSALLRAEQLPSQPIAVGLVVGVVAIAVEELSRRRNRSLSSVSFCVGLYLPATIGIGIFCGALTRRIGQGRQRQDLNQDGVLAAAAIISADAVVGLVFAGLSILGFWNLAAKADSAASLELTLLCGLLTAGALVWNFRK